MSYSNPKIYLQDPLAFANSFKKSFQAGFQGVEDHIATVRSQVEQKNKALKKTGEDLQDAIDKSKNLAGAWSSKLAEAGSFWMRDNRAFEKRNEEGGALVNVASARAVGGSSAASMQRAEGSFKGVATQLNQISEYLVDPNKYKNTDKSNKDYANIQMIMDYAKSNPESLTIEQNGDDFSAYITYPDPNGEWVGEDGKYSTISTDVLGAKLTTLQSREDFDKQFDTAIDKFKTTIKSEIDRDKEESRKDNQDLFIDGIQRTRERTGPMLRRMQLSEKTRQNTADGPGFFEKTFANLGDNVPFDFEPNVEVYGNTQKELFSKTRIGKVIVDEIENAKDKEVLEPHLRAILDLPLSDKRMDGHISQMRKQGLLSAAEVDELYEALEEYQFQVVKEVVDLDVIASGVDSESVLRKRQKPYGSNSRTVSKVSPEDKDVLTNMWNYSGEKMQFIPGDKELKTGGTVTSLDEDETFTRGKIRASGRQQDVGFVEQRQGSEKLKIFYGEQGRSKEVDKKDPDDMFFAFKDLAVGKVKEKDFDNIMLKEFSTNDGLARLDNNGMSKWVKWLSRRGQKDRLINYLAEKESRGIPLMSSTINTWEDFYKENKKAIDAKKRAIDAEMINAARANKIK